MAPAQREGLVDAKTGERQSRQERTTERLSPGLALAVESSTLSASVSAVMEAAESRRRMMLAPRIVTAAAATRRV
jgi:hypothetical protein